VKSLFLTILILFSSVLLVAQSTQKGITLEYQGRQAKTALGKVRVRAYGSTAMSDSQGRFGIQFNDLKVGERVIGVNVSKQGYVLFNKDAIDQWNVSNEEFQIVLCREDQFNAWVDQYYDLGLASYQQQYDKECAEARKQREANALTEQQLNASLQEAYSRFQSSMQLLHDRSEVMARVDESQLDTIRLQALDLVREGLFDEAIALLDRQNYDAELERLAKKSQLGQQQIALSDENIAIANANVERLIEALEFEINARKLQGGKANYDLCKQYWMQIALADTTNYNNAFDCACFMQEQNEYKQAERFYSITLRSCSKLVNTNLAAYVFLSTGTLGNLAVLHHRLGDYARAEQEYQAVLGLWRQLASSNPDLYNLFLAWTLNNLATLHSEHGQYERAELEFQEATSLLRQSVDVDSVTCNADLAATLSNHAGLHADQLNYSQSEQEYHEALALFRQCATADPNTYNPELASLLNNLGALHLEDKQYDLAASELNEALVLHRQLASTNPDAYNPDLVLTLYNLARLHINLKDNSQAQQEYREAIALFSQLVTINPTFYNPFLANSLNDLGFIYFLENNCEQAEIELNKALKIRRHLAADNPDIYNSELAATLLCLTQVYDELQRTSDSEAIHHELIGVWLSMGTKAEPIASQLFYAARWTLYYPRAKKECSDALIIYRHLAETDPDRYLPTLSDVLDYLGVIHKCLESSGQAEAAYLEALAIRRQLATVALTEYGAKLAKTLSRLAELYREQNRYVEIEPIYLELIDVYKTTDTELNTIATTLFNLAYSQHNFLQHVEQAEQTYFEALAIFRHLAEQNPAEYSYAVSATLNNLGVIHESLESYSQAEAEYLEALAIRQRLATDNPDTYNPEVEQSETNLANVRRKMGK